MPSEKILKEADAHIDTQFFESVQPEPIEEKPQEEQVVNFAGTNLSGNFISGPGSGVEFMNGPAGTEFKGLTGEEKDALGEVGNICMGSSSTTLSMLVNQKVSITSPWVNLSSLEELYQSFETPHLVIYVHFTGGISGYNLLIMKLDDAAVLADLMMGGDGTNTSEGLSEIGVSAASEAMNQMIGSASTAMATMFGRVVNITPPTTKIYYSNDEPRLPEKGREEPVVVVRFKITIGAILDTHIMQVMGIDTAREQAAAILNQLSLKNGKDNVQGKDGGSDQNMPVGSKGVVYTGQEENVASPLDEEIFQKDSVQPAVVSKDPCDMSTTELEAIPLPASVRQPGGASPEATSSILNQRHLDLILDIPLKVTVLLGRTRWPIKEILGVAPGSVVELHNQVDDPVEVLVNGTLVAMGEVVIVNENFGVRITNIIGPEDRLKNLGR